MKKIFFVTIFFTYSFFSYADGNHQNQIDKLGNDEKELKNKIEKFKADEVNHKNIAYEKGATSDGIYSIMSKVIKTSSKIAISISEKI